MSTPPDDDTDVTDAADRTGSVHDDDRFDTDVPADAGYGTPDPDAYAHPRNRCDDVRLDSGDLVIYDGAESDAWLQSSVALDITTLR